MPSFHTKKADFLCQKVFESPKNTYFFLKIVLLASWGAIGVPKYIMGKFMKCFNFFEIFETFGYVSWCALGVSKDILENFMKYFLFFEIFETFGYHLIF